MVDADINKVWKLMYFWKNYNMKYSHAHLIYMYICIYDIYVYICSEKASEYTISVYWKAS